MHQDDATLKLLFERSARGLLRTLTGGAAIRSIRCLIGLNIGEPLVQLIPKTATDGLQLSGARKSRLYATQGLERADHQARADQQHHRHRHL